MQLNFAILLHYFFTNLCFRMRYLAIILVIILSVLFVLPCTDDNNSCEGTIGSSSSQKAHSHNQDTADYCSPFCQCTCCGISKTSFLLFPSIPDIILFFPIAKTNGIWNMNLISSYTGSIWRPPNSNV